MGLDVAIRSRPIPSGHHVGVADTVKAGAIGAGAGTLVSAAFHHFGPPKMALGTPWLKATLGVGLMVGLSAAALHATNGADSVRGGKGTNSLLGSTAISAVAFAIPGIWIHGLMDFSGKPVNRWAAAAGVALTGALAGPIIHQFTMPRD